ncbi:unnamed protein product [Phytomonas sp. EM1]|nr:unnamed protein product [Phytomonas sp. EM1]|eukprot:CCW64773.1 unnamed protein product [Phytomonas sp. isolate EM1]
MSSRICRRLRLAINDSLDNSPLRAQLFLALASYGVLEFVSFDGSISGGHLLSSDSTGEGYSIGNIVAQFQKLSCAELFHADAGQVACQAQQRWRVAFEPAAVPLVCSSLFISSTNPLVGDTLLDLSSIVPAHSASPTEASRVAPWLEEKLLKVPGSTALLDGSTILNPSMLSSTIVESAAGNSQSLLQDITTVYASCIGPYVGILHFDNAYDADHYLRSRQLSLAKEGVFVMYAGPSTKNSTTGLAQAVSHLLTRHVISPSGSVHLIHNEQVDGLVRGFVVKMKPNGRCVVDAGVTTESYQAIMVNTHSNFLRVAVGEEVYIELQPSAADAMDASTSARTSTLESNLRGVLKRVADDHSSLQSQLTASSNVSFGSRRAQLLPTTARPTTASLNKTPQLTVVAAKALASKLFQSIQRAKADGTLSQGEHKEGDATYFASNRCKLPGVSLVQKPNRLCSYPRGLHLLSQVYVQVNQINDNGLNCTLLSIEAPHGRSITYTGGLLCNATTRPGSGGWPPVFIPSSLIPASAPDADPTYAVSQVPTVMRDWRNFAVVGERLTVAILYTTSIANSHATRQLVASKLDMHLRYAASMPRPNISTEGFAESDVTQEVVHEDFAEESKNRTLVASEMGDEAMVAVGLRFDGVPVHTIEVTDMGAFHGGPFPCHLVYPCTSSTSSMWSLPLVLSTTSSSSVVLGRHDLRTASMRFVVSEVLDDAACGRYVVVLSAADYEKKVEAEVQAEEDRRTKQWNDVKKRLASVLGEDAVQDLNRNEDVFTKKTRTE